ncbi:GNAT family N-acetyltransferase [Shewanella violacea]|uniref:Acetyltransferase, GNAT family n=1 Tax=Shewanella violacea (strain JCM 10179 / CIP 106290 / LMG 19151 / DSS12) TaxID=637905 RepID=D4ZHL0_SHEVD|nr:GNAT family N-acetyltransferase [Shewanella violacea]BAJ01159.1 acetyltransferase, GNAT family [Shewanella violacea DSS12]
MRPIELSDNKSYLDVRKIHLFLCNESTWAKNISYQLVCKSIENSICIGAYIDKNQIGFSRIITDHATFANLVDVIVWPKFRGQGVSKLLMEAVLNHESVKSVRRFTLATSNAHGLYDQFGFSSLSKPDAFMEIYKPNIYQTAL